MGNVTFDEPEAGRRPVAQKQSGLTSLVIGMGLAKDAKGAQKILLLVVVIAIALSVFLILSTSSPSVRP